MDTRKTNTYTNTFDPSRSYICTSAAIVGITWSAVEIVRRYDHKQPYKILLPAGMWACGLLAGYLPLSYQSTMRVGNEIAYFIWSPGASITKHIVARVGTHYLNKVWEEKSEEEQNNRLTIEKSGLSYSLIQLSASMAGHTVGKLTKPIWDIILYSAYDRVTRMLSRPAPARIEPSAPVPQEPLPTSPISASIPPITINTRIPIDNEQLQRFNLLHSKGYKICFYGGGDWTIEVTPIIAVALMFFGAIIEIKKGNDKIWASSGQPLSLNWCIYYLKLIGFDAYIPNNKKLFLSSKAAASYVNQGKEIEFKHPVRSKFFLTKPEPGNTHLSFQDFITGLKGCGFRFSSERAENLDGNSGIEAIIQHLNSNGIIGLIKGTRRIWLSGNIQGLGVSRFIPRNFITSVTTTATPNPIPAPIAIAPVSVSMPRNNPSTESADREPLLTLVTEFSIFRQSLSHGEKEYDFEAASDDEEMSTSSESEGEEELPLLVADKEMLTEVILPQDNNQSTSGSEFSDYSVGTTIESDSEEELPVLIADNEVLTEVILPQDNNQSTSGSEFSDYSVGATIESDSEEELPVLIADNEVLTEVILPQDNNQSTSGSEFYHHHVDLDGLQKAIATYSSSKPKVKSGIFSGQMSRELRDITASMQAIEKGDLKGIHQFIQLAKKLGHHNPILEEAIKVRRQISQLNSKENNFKRCLQK